MALSARRALRVVPHFPIFDSVELEPTESGREIEPKREAVVSVKRAK